jgi:hypothetical protein
VTPLSEIPGVKLSKEQEEGIMVANEAKPTPVILNRKERHQLKSILAGRLWKYYQQLSRQHPGYNPFRDGIPKDLPPGDPRNLSGKGVDLQPASDAEIFEWLYKVVGEKASVVDRKRFGSGIQDMAIRIE